MFMKKKKIQILLKNYNFNKRVKYEINLKNINIP